MLLPSRIVLNNRKSPLSFKVGQIDEFDLF